MKLHRPSAELREGGSEFVTISEERDAAEDVEAQPSSRPENESADNYNDEQLLSVLLTVLGFVARVRNPDFTRLQKSSN